jgi:hypothetical protein
MSDARSSAGGAGPLYPQTPAAMAAAERSVEIPGSDDDSGVSETDNPTGERQAAENRDNEPPA